MRSARLFPLCLVLLFAVASCASAPAELEESNTPRLNGALASFDSCDQALEELKAAATSYFSKTSLPDGAQTAPGQVEAEGQEKASDHSETNVHEEGVDEPDVVKNDGKRVLLLRDGKLTVVDANSREVTGSVTISDGHEGPSFLGGAQLLLDGDRALVIGPQAQPSAPAKDEDSLFPTQRTSIKLVDLSGGKPEVVNNYEVDGGFVDAREVGGVARLVVRSAPDIETPKPGPLEEGSDAKLKAVAESTIEDWLPKYKVDGHKGQVPCDALARPDKYSGTSTLTTLSFDLAKKLDDGSPVSIEADGETVYGSKDSLYIANDRREITSGGGASLAQSHTEIYHFSWGGKKTPSYRGAATVKGYLLNQYAMSEWDGHLRVATTDGVSGGDSSSAVQVLRIGKRDMKSVGEVDGLGPGERIEGVRFDGDTGYVVTFEQTDPLYTIDLSDPKHPDELGELKITGYSAYLHSIEDERLLGLGPEADESGNTTGLQVSLFDVAERDDVTRTDEYEVDNGSSIVEQQPRAFLYWPDSKLICVPVDDGQNPKLVALKADGDQLEKLGEVTHDGNDPYGIVRSMVVDDALWTISADGVKVSALDDLKTQDWIEYDKK